MPLQVDKQGAQAAAAPHRSASARLGYVDGLRALAALYVVAHHVMLTAWATTHAPWWADWLQDGHLAVSVFIVLSGYSLMLPVARAGTHIADGGWGFYRRRARRILPPYYLAMALSLGLIWLLIGHKTGTLWDLSLPVTGQSILQHALLVQDFSPTDDTTINSVFWSIALECQIYLFFPALVWLWRRYYPVFVTLLAVVLANLLAIVVRVTPLGQIPGYAVYAVAPQYLGLFTLGMLGATLSGAARSAAGRRLGRWRLWDGLAVVGLLGLILIPNTQTLARWLILDLLTGVMTLGVLLAASQPAGGWRTPIRALLEWRPLVWIGGFSYSLYLIHAPLIQVLWQYVFHPLNVGDTTTYLALMLVGGPLIILAAWGFWWLCERPFLNSRRSQVAGAREARE